MAFRHDFLSTRDTKSRIRGNQRDAEVAEHGEADFLHHEVTGKAVRRLDDDSPDAVAGNAGERGDVALMSQPFAGIWACAIVVCGIAYIVKRMHRATRD
jgi:hypothetical protein